MGESIGNLDIGATIGSYIGLLFLCLLFSAISIFSSSLSSNQLNSFIIAVFFNLSFYYGFDVLSQLFDSGKISILIQKIGIIKHYELLSKGLIYLVLLAITIRLNNNGAVAERLRTGLQSRVHRFESGPHLQKRNVFTIEKILLL